MKRRTYVAIIDENKRVLVKLSDDKKALSLSHFSSNDKKYYPTMHKFFKKLGICIDMNWRLILNTFVSPFEGIVDEQFLIYEASEQEFDAILMKNSAFKNIDVTNDTYGFVDEKKFKLSKSLVRFFKLF